MTDFADSWNLSRGRFDTEIADLTQEQLRWKLHPHALSIGEMAIHVAGVETSFSSQLLGTELTAEQAKIKSCATEGVVNDNPFPFSAEQITPELVKRSLDFSKSLLQPLMDDPSDEVLVKELKSALGPIITGKGALARLAFHSAYHQGQAYMMKTSPDFPA